MSHVRWEDLLDEETEPGGGAAVPGEGGPAAAAQASAPAAPPDFEAATRLDPQLARLVEERAALQARLERLVGGGAPETPADPRQARQFPILEHTAQTRLAEKLEHQRATDTRLASQRLHARKKAESAEAERVEELRRARILTTRRARDRARLEAERRAARERREAAARKVVHRALERAAEAAFGRGERADLADIQARALALARAGGSATSLAPRVVARLPLARAARRGLELLDRPLRLPELPALAMPMDLGSVGSVGSVGDVGGVGDIDLADGDPMAGAGRGAGADDMAMDPAALLRDAGMDRLPRTPRAALESFGVRAPRADDMNLERAGRRARDLLDRPRKRGGDLR